MTSRERLLAVLRRDMPDTVPIYLRGVSPFGEKMNWMGVHHPSYERLRSFAFANCDLFHGIGFDSGAFVSAAPVSITDSVVREDDRWKDARQSIETPLGELSNVTRYSKENLYDVMEVEFFIKDEEDFERFMSIPYEPPRPEVQPRMRRADAEVGEHGVPVVGIPSAIMIAHRLLGSEGLAMWSVMHRDKLLGIFRTIRDRLLDYVGYLLKEGAGPLFSYVGPELATAPLMSPGDFHEFVTDIDKPLHDLIRSYGAWSWVHCHGRLSEVLEDFAEMGATVVEPLEVAPGGDVPLAEAKRRIGEKVILMGNMPYEALLSWGPRRIEEKVKADCEAAMEGGGYIMMPAASPFEPVLSDVGFQGYKTYVEAGRKYGRYR